MYKNVFIHTYILRFSGYWKNCFHHQSALLLQKQNIFSLLKAKTKSNQVIMWLSKSTVNHDFLITYLKPLSPPDPWYLSLVKDIKDQLAHNCPEWNGKHVHHLSLPRRWNAAFLCSPDSCSLRGFWANPTRTQFSHLWMMQLFGNMVDPVIYVCHSATGVLKLSRIRWFQYKMLKGYRLNSESQIILS